MLGCATRPAPHPPAGEPQASRAELSGAVAILAAALEREHESIAAYTAGIPLLSGGAGAAAKQFLAHEFSHAAELSALIRKGGGKPSPQAPNGYDLGNPRGAADVLALLHSIERTAIATYIDAIPRIAAGPVRATIASILANEAQHISVLRGVAGLTAVPAPLVAAAE
jgi:rubrerythrin